MMPKQTKKQNKITAWAVVPIKDFAFGTCLIFNQQFEHFSHGIFPAIQMAEEYCKRINPLVKSKVVKVEIKII